MHIGLITLELTGHLNPLTTVGQELTRRGHQVTLMAGRPAEKMASRRGLDFIPLGIQGDLDYGIEREVKRMGEMMGLDAMWQGSNIVALTDRMVARDLPAILDDNRFDGLIVDQMSVTGFNVASKRNIPMVIATTSLMLTFDPWVPLAATTLRYRDDLYGLLRNKAISQILKGIHACRLFVRRQTVDPLQLVFDHTSGLARIVQQPDFLNYPKKGQDPDHCHYTGPWHESQRDDGVDFPWEKLGDEPIIYASMGTLQNSLAPVFRSIIEALGQLPYQAVVSRGGSQVPLPESIPENVIVVDFAPQLKLLERTKLMITHAGMNTALECLTRGVPMLCLPVTNDQPGVAMRIEWLGAGRVIPVKKVTTNRIHASLIAMLEDPSYERQAAFAADQLRGQDGLKTAADIVELAFRTGKVVTKSTLVANEPIAFSDAKSCLVNEPLVEQTL